MRAGVVEASWASSAFKARCRRGCGAGDIRQKTKAAIAGRTESQLNNSSRQLDWLWAIKLMMQGHWKWAQYSPAPYPTPPPARQNKHNSTNEKSSNNNNRKREPSSRHPEWRSWHSSLRGGVATGRGVCVVTTKSTAVGPITMVGASTSLLTLLTVTLTNTRPSIY